MTPAYPSSNAICGGWVATLLVAWLLAPHPAAAQPPRAAPAPDNALPAAVARALQQAQVPAAALAAMVLPATAATAANAAKATNAATAAPSGRHSASPRWQVQPDRPMPPASTLKLLTTVVALDRLGPNHRGFTDLLSAAALQGDVLAGDLVLRGGADPELGLAQLGALLAELRWLGVREIAGDIVLDRQLFRPALPDAATPPFDEWPELAYNVVPDALALTQNLMGLEISSQDAGQPGAVLARALPPLPGVEIDASALRLTDRPCRDWAEDWASPPLRTEAAPGRLRIALRGGFPKDCTQRTGLALIDRNALAERHLRWVWQGLGGQWQGQVRDADAPLVVASTAAQATAPGNAEATEPAPATTPTTAETPPHATPPPLRLLARRWSRPWGELLRGMNKQSDNPSARLLYLSLGLAAMADQPTAATADLAARSVLAWLDEQHIPTAGLVLDNGSGLSRSERITPRQMVMLLQAAQTSRWAPELMASLPVAGVDGSMRHRLTTSRAAGWARLKSGSLKDVVALAGYVPDPKGRLWALAAMVHHDQALAARPALDALVDWVASGGMSRARP